MTLDAPCRPEPTQGGCRRDRLPNRRLQSTEVVAWRGQEWLMSVGFDHFGTVREAFVKGLKSGSAMDAIMDDACVLLSLLLQAGYTASDVDSHLGREGVDSLRAPLRRWDFRPRWRQPWNVKSATVFAPSITFPPELGRARSPTIGASQNGDTAASVLLPRRRRSDGVKSSRRCRHSALWRLLK